MVYIHARVFCCCLPVRLGIFILAGTGAFIGGVLTIGGWMQVAHLMQHPLSQRDNVALYVQTVMVTLLCIVSIFGIVGAATQRRSIVHLFGIMLAVHLLLHFATGVFFIYTLFNEDASDLTVKCTDAAIDDLEKQFCGKGMTVVKGLVVAFSLLSWIFQFYECVLVSSYAEELKEVKEELPPMKSAPPRTGPLPVTTYNSYAGANYPFTQPANSYGAQGHTMV